MKNVTPKIPEIDVRIVKVAECESVSGKSTLTYHIGCTEDGAIQLRVYANTAAGFFSQEWLPLTSIDQVLLKAGNHFTSFALLPLFRGKSQNNTAFLLAVLRHEGLVNRSTDKKRCYEKADAGRFIAEVKALIASKVALNADDKATKTAKPVKKTPASEASSKAKSALKEAKAIGAESESGD